MADTAIRERSRGGPGGARKISRETFRKKYLSREDTFKYEWVNGAVEKAPRTMDKSQQLEEVHAYHGLKMEIRLGDDLCTAEPAIPGFEISVSDILKK